MKMREEAAGLRSTPLCTGHSPDRIRKSEDLPHLVTSYNRYLDLLLWPPVRSGDEDVLPGPDGQAEAGHHLVIQGGQKKVCSQKTKIGHGGGFLNKK